MTLTQAQASQQHQHMQLAIQQQMQSHHAQMKQQARRSSFRLRRVFRELTSSSLLLAIAADGSPEPKAEKQQSGSGEWRTSCEASEEEPELEPVDAGSCRSRRPSSSVPRLDLTCSPPLIDAATAPQPPAAAPSDLHGCRQLARPSVSIALRPGSRAAWIPLRPSRRTKLPRRQWRTASASTSYCSSNAEAEGNEWERSGGLEWAAFSAESEVAGWNAQPLGHVASEHTWTLRERSGTSSSPCSVRFDASFRSSS